MTAPSAGATGTTATAAVPSAAPTGAQAGRNRANLPKLADPAAPLLEVDNLVTHFASEGGTVHAVDGITFRLDFGEALGIAGESGCGKTTTALSLVGLLPSNARIEGGAIRLYGIDLVPKSENALRRYRWRELSIVVQGAMNALNPVQRVVDQITEPITERLRLKPKAARAKAAELLELVGIPRKRGNAYPHELSGGMRQ
ncbi:MAG TPA: ATP-binding cassette domain-containing protein, partial [Methylomirabilota bacterium]|nr:ATP-binding cassette domain-containing protein [Methylomirabilota bacterium]